MPLEPSGGVAANGDDFKVFRAHHTHQFFHEPSRCARTAQTGRRLNMIDMKDIARFSHPRENDLPFDIHLIAVFIFVKMYLFIHESNIGLFPFGGEG